MESGSDPLVTIAIPCYEMHGRGAEFLDFGLSRIASQSYRWIEVVVADHSTDDSLARICDAWQTHIKLQYVRNPLKRGSSSANLNVAIKNARGELIKILCQDDYLFDETAIERTVAAFRPTDAWLVTSYLHTTDQNLSVQPARPDAESPHRARQHHWNSQLSYDPQSR